MQAPTSIYDTSPENFHFGGGSTDTVIHPAVAAALVIVVVILLIAKRKWILAPLFLFLFLAPSGQVFYVGGVHLYCSRILVVAGGLRMLWARFSRSGDLLAGGFNAIDGVFLTWALYRAMAGILLFMQTGAVINQVGFLWDALGMYFLLRFLIQDQADIERIFQVFAVLAVVIAAEMVREHYTNQDLFGAILGGTRSTLEVRNGLIRAQGPFQHALIAGAFGAALFPAFVWLWKGHKGRVLAVLGMVASVTIAFMARVSTPILALVAGIALIWAWPIRGYLKYLRWGTVAALVGLNIVMKAPVWYLIARIDLVGGSTSYQRAQLLDLFVKHFSEWWLIGTSQNANWGWDMWDTANQYVNEGERGGLVVFLCFLALIWLGFRKLAEARVADGVDHKHQRFLWLLGACLFTHCVAYFGVDYYDQSRFAWYATLAMISAATASILRSRAPAEEPEGAILADFQLIPAVSAPIPPVTRVAVVERTRPLKGRPAYSRKLGKT
jgi:hypothetical protein